MTDDEVLRKQLVDSHRWLMSRGDIPGQCGSEVRIAGAALSDGSYHGIKLSSGDHDLWWLSSNRGGLIIDWARYTKLLVSGPQYHPQWSKTEWLIPVLQDWTRDAQGFSTLSADPKRLANLLITYLTRSAGVAHKEMKQASGQCSDPHRQTRSEEHGKTMARCYRFVADIKISPLRKIPK